MAGSRQNWIASEHGADWVFGTDSPKNAAVAAGAAAGHQVFVEQVTDRGRRFSSYPSVTELASAFGNSNAHLFEVLVEGRPVKIYLDLEWTSCDEGDEQLSQIITRLGQALQDILNVQLDPATVRVSCASGQGEAGIYRGQTKHSYHVVVDNGYAFRDVKQVRSFVDLAFPGDDRVDRSPYGRNQSFKVIHSSKLNSPRVQVPRDGYGYPQHMVSVFERGSPALYCSDKLRHSGARAISQQVTAPEPLVPARRTFVSDDVDIHSVKALLQYFPNGPAKADKQPFEVYLTVAYVCKNEAEPLEVFLQWAARYEGSSPATDHRIWDSIHRRTDGYDVRTLRAMLHRANPSVLMDIQNKYLDQVMLPTVTLSDHGFDSVEYCEPRMEPWLDQARAYKHLLVKGPMGSGKTHQIVRTIEDLRPASLLVVTPRHLFARSMLGTLRKVLPDLQIYKDLPHKDRRCDHIVCQLESLWTLGRGYDVVILDESESILHQFSSPTVIHFEEICAAYKSILLGAKHVLHTDAFLSDRTLLACAAIDPSASRCFINNTWIPQGRRAYCAGVYNKAKDGLLSTARHLRAESNVVVCASRQLANQITAVLEPSGPTALVSSASSDDVKRQLEDVNSYLQPFRHFVYTSAITVGTSYDRQDHFDNLLMYAPNPLTNKARHDPL